MPRKSAITPAERSALPGSSHHRGLDLFQQGCYEEAVRLLSIARQEHESSEVCSDWAVAELAWGQRKVEQALRRALALDSTNAEAALNLGVLLANWRRTEEAIPFLQQAVLLGPQPPPAAAVQILKECQGEASAQILGQARSTWQRFISALEQAPEPGPAPRKPFDHSPGAVATLHREVESIQWYHQIDLGHGILTPGCQDSHEELRLLGLPARFDELTVLDVESWDGFYAFEAERRGAKRVVAIDGFAWRNGVPGASKAGFDLAHWALGSKVEAKDLTLAEAYAKNIGAFDVVLCEAYYPQREPLATFEGLFALTNGLLILQTDVDLHTLAAPAVAFHPHRTVGDDLWNWWLPNPSAVLEMLHTVGFRKVAIAGKVETPGGFAGERGRIIVHAER